MFEMTIDMEKKYFYVKVSGFIKMEEAQQLITEYQKSVGKFDPSEYTLIADASEQKAVDEESLQGSLSFLMLLLQAPFKKRIALKFKSTIAQSQILRLGKQVDGFDGILFVDDFDSAMKLLA